MEPTLSKQSSYHVRLLTANDERLWIQYRITNRTFFAPWEPRFPDAEYAIERQAARLHAAIQTAIHDQGYLYGIFAAGEAELLGHIRLSNVSRGAFQNAYLGYGTAQDWNGRGVMTSGVQQVLDKAFTIHQLHRVQAAVMPRNTGSIRVLEKAGFQREGLARRYLKINDVWEDHYLFAILSDEA